MASFPLSEGGLPLQPQPASAPRLFPQAWLARRVPWPQYAAGTPLNVPQAALSQAASGSLPCLRLAYAFFYRPPSEAAALLREAVRVGQEVWLADFKLAERNLEWPACAFSRLLPGLWPGSEGSRALRRFLQAGGLEGLVAELMADRAQERPLQLHRQARLMGGGAVLLCLRPEGRGPRVAAFCGRGRQVRPQTRGPAGHRKSDSDRREPRTVHAGQTGRHSCCGVMARKSRGLELE